MVEAAPHHVHQVQMMVHEVLLFQLVFKRGLLFFIDVDDVCLLKRTDGFEVFFL